MDDDLFAILVWALLYATIFAPIIFRAVLKRYMLANKTSDLESSVPKHPEHCASGHLPVLVAEKLEKEDLEIREKAELYEEAQKEIGRLTLLISQSQPNCSQSV